MEIIKKTIAVVLALILVAGLLPVQSWATEAGSGDRVRQEPETYYWYVTTEEKSRTEIITEVEQDESGVYHSHDEEVTTTGTVKELHEVYMNPVSTMSARNGETGFYSFTTFEGLKELASGTYDDWTYAYYEGTEDLVIDEDLFIPTNFGLIFLENNSKVTVAEGVTLKLNGNLQVDNLTINGTLTNRGYLQVNKGLEINGMLKLYSGVYVDSAATISGDDNISKMNTWVSLYVVHGDLENTAELKKVLAEASSDNSGWIHQIEIGTWQNGGFTIDSDVTIPESVEIQFYGEDPVIIEEGATLTLDCSFAYIAAPMNVEGTLVNNSQYIYVDAPVTFVADDSYAGGGKLVIQPSFDDPMDAVPGMDMENKRLATSDWGDQWELQDITGKTQLGKPTDLQWNKALDWETGELIEQVGSVAWKVAEPDEDEAVIKFYQKDTGAVLGSYGWGFRIDEEETWRAVEAFNNCEPETGELYFTVRSRAVSFDSYSSDDAVSPTWKYTKPAEALGSCGVPYWDGTIARWDAPADADGNTTYSVEFYYRTEKNDVMQSCGSSWGMYGTNVEMGNWVFTNKGDGYYYFRVRALSDDITETYHGPWSDYSEPIYLNEDGSLRTEEPDDSHDHSYETVVTEPTCTEKGYTTYTCACGDSYVDDYVDATGHSYENGVCTLCGEKDDTEEDILWGDADRNGRIQTNDAKLILQYCAEMVEDEALNLAVCDVDGNGRYQTNDAKLILQYCAEMIENFPIAG